MNIVFELHIVNNIVLYYFYNLFEVNESHFSFCVPRGVIEKPIVNDRPVVGLRASCQL